MPVNVELARAPKVPENKPLNIANFFLDSKAGEPYLNTQYLVTVHHNTKLDGPIRYEASFIVFQIAKDGDSSICHLCMPAIIRNGISRAGIRTISAFRDWLVSPGDERVKIKILNAENLQLARERLELFDGTVENARLEGVQ